MLYNLDPRIGNNFIDANVLDRNGTPEAAAVDTILELYWRADHDFRLILAYSVKAEIGHTRTPAEVKLRAASMIFSTRVGLTDDEEETQKKVRALIQGNSKPGQHARDAFHLVESAKYGGRHFITNDGRLLKKANQIWGMLQLKVLKPSEWLTAYKAHESSVQI
jgi:predicted nucleic acid-binding protein